MGCRSAETLFTPPPPPADLTQPCPPVPAGDPKNLGELLQADVELIALYHQCRARHQALSDWSLGGKAE